MRPIPCDNYMHDSMCCSMMFICDDLMHVMLYYTYDSMW